MNPLSHDGARHSPALQRSYTQLVKNGLVPLRKESNLTGSDLHILGSTGLFTLPNYLYAAPNALPFSHLRCMVGTRDRTVSQGIADSGGYQISTGKLNLTERKRHEILRFSETQEAALIIDAPTSAIGKRGSSFFSFGQCLEFSRDNALYAIRNREPHKTKFLNVMQGRNRREAREWRTNTMHFNDDRVFGERALDGVAFAGATRLHLSVTLEHLIVFRDSGLLRDNAHFHVLGTGHPKVACALTAILDGLRETLGRRVELTFDSATPF